MSNQPFDAEACAQQARRVAAGDVDEFMPLVRQLWPELVGLVSRSRRIHQLSGGEDDVHNVVLSVIEKLSNERYHALKLYLPWQERHPDKTFHDWLRVVVANAARDYIRARRRRAPDSAADVSPIRLLNDFASTLPLDELGTRPPVTAAQTARQLLEFAGAHLPEEQASAVAAWLQGHDFDEIASRLALDDGSEARKLLRAGIATLRRQFAAEPGYP